MKKYLNDIEIYCYYDICYLITQKNWRGKIISEKKIINNSLIRFLKYI